MWEAAAYSQNILKVMLDPATWLIAATLVFWWRPWPLPARLVAALAASFVFCLVWLVWPSGESGRYYSWLALGYEFVATGLWFALFSGARRLFGKPA